MNKYEKKDVQELTGLTRLLTEPKKERLIHTIRQEKCQRQFLSGSR